MSETEVSETYQPYVEGQLLIDQYSKSKMANKRVVRVAKVHERGLKGYKYYTYDLERADGTMVYNQSGGGYRCFAAYQQIIQKKIQATIKILTNHEDQYKASTKLEADAKQLFAR